MEKKYQSYNLSKVDVLLICNCLDRMLQDFYGTNPEKWDCEDKEDISYTIDLIAYLENGGNR